MVGLKWDSGSYKRGGDGSQSKFLTQVELGKPFLVRVWVWKISPKNHKFFNFFTFGLKKSLQVSQKVPGSIAGRPLIYAGQKYAQVGSVLISKEW